ncbi:hypothetical protein G3I59_38370 [Amycolatopsis rubida]|uniref:Secreted protein n=1 Tax=Amycolatopsis rubida TaxID=112413 RepID=A0ABX0C2C7_9PSEU|nr:MULTISPECIES: hypothetical protein [Amycolatopsis]MYW96323.1 hypothetical protein [Amycolatopsis rubida]NEC61313.1 hypothetical protein [Amycolatopsis rubida]OAP24150.1 hypothetical protein A4R44_04923 [Amycolatopsis sp. M39]
MKVLLRKFVPVAAAAVLAVTLAQPAAASPAAGPAASPEWRVADGQLLWTAPKPLFGDGAVEFWSGGKLLGRAQPRADLRTFSLPAGGISDLRGLEVRVGGRSLTEPPRATAKQPAPAPLPELPANAVDPGKPGQFSTVKGEYSLDPVRLPGLDGPIEMRGVVVAPKHAPGNRPLVVFLHGRHQPCYDPADPDHYSTAWPCAAGMLPIPSYRGYLQTQELLASQGFVTVSISANAINALDNAAEDGGAQARSSLVRLHLAHWADWSGSARASAPRVVRDSPAADLSNVLLVGHSRGGEGVNRAAMDSLYPPPGDTGFSGPVRWKIRGDVLIAPTVFGLNPVPDVPSVTFLPSCDGDVSDLQGQQYIDGARGVSRDTALHSALYVSGANHNYFNAEWTPGVAVAPANDDFYSRDPDPNCSPGVPARLTDAQQRAVGATYVAAAAQLFQKHDPRVQPLLDGSGVRAPSADPAHVLTHALGGARTPVLIPDSSTEVTGGGDVCRQVGPDQRCLTNTGASKSPHFVGLEDAPDPTRTAVHVRSAGAPAQIRLPRPVSADGARALAMRVIAPENAPAASFDVAVADSRGKRTKLGSFTVTGLAGTERTKSFWGQEVRVPLPPHLEVASLELTPRTAGSEAWLLDAYAWRPGLPDPAPAPLTRVDLGALTVKEGDSGSKTYQIPVTVTGDGGGSLRVFRTDPDSPTSAKWTYQAVTLAPGQHTLDLPATVVGNTRWSWPYRLLADVKATRGTVVGAAEGAVNVENDDPEPEVSVGKTDVSAVEGGALAWPVNLSAVADSDLYVTAEVKAPKTGPELMTSDVDPQWLIEHGVDPKKSQPLSATGVTVAAPVLAGKLSAELTIPTVRHDGTDPVKHVLLHMTESGPDIDLTGTVTDAG